MNWLHPADSSISLNSTRSKYHPETGSWLPQHPSFLAFRNGRAAFLWLCGVPGCGKTMLSSTIIMHLRYAKPHFPVLYFFFGDPGQLTIDQLIRSVIAQLFVRFKSSRNHLRRLYEQYEHSTASTEVLIQIFHKMMLSVPGVYLVIDAMDECSDRSTLTT